MPKTNPAARIACRNAWASIRRAKAIYGGSARDYLSEAMRLAWADLRTDPVMCRFRRKPAGYSDLMSATIPI